MSKKSFLVICGLALGMSVNAQYLRTSYFTKVSQVNKYQLACL